MNRDERQSAIFTWACKAFSHAEVTNIPQRGLRLIEEAMEAYQSCGGSEEMAHKLVSYVFSRPTGELGQELGGVAVTLLCLAASAGFSADKLEEQREVRRVLSKPLEEFTARNALKKEAGLKHS